MNLMNLMNRRPGQQRMQGKWSPMAAAILALVLICTVGTVLVGRELYKITGQQTHFSTR